MFKCTVAGTPGTWQQILAAAVTADPSSGSVPTGYLILNVSTGDVKRHAGSYSWEIKVGSSASSNIGFYGVTPVTQPSGADQASVTLGNTDGEIAGLSISDPPTQAEVQALRDKCEKLADDLRNLSTLIHSLRTALAAEGLIRIINDQVLASYASWVIDHAHLSHEAPRINSAEVEIPSA